MKKKTKKKKKSRMRKFIEGCSLALAVVVGVSSLVIVLASISLFATALATKEWLTCIYIVFGWIILCGILNVIIGD